jgi:L-ascorbate 6-phosphate lactonase
MTRRATSLVSADNREVFVTTSSSAVIQQISDQAILEGAVGVWWLGQASVVLRLGTTVVYVDPYLDPEERRLMRPPFAAEEVTNADLVLLTHDHGDHIDPASLPAIAAASPKATFIAPAPLRYRAGKLVGNVERVGVASVGTSVRFGDLEIIPIAAAHETFDLHPEHGHPYLGYVIRVGGLTVYHAGDTVPYEGMVERLAELDIDLAFLPINGRDFFRTRAGTIGNMDYREAAEIASAAGIDTVVPIHYGMFAGNTVPPGYFVTYVAERGLDVNVHVPALAKAWIYQRA